MTTITKTQAMEARKLLRHYEAQKKAEARAKRCALPCTALVHAYFKSKNDEYGYDAWDADAQKLYRAVKSAEQSALKRRRKGIVDAIEQPMYRRHRWTVAMDNALMQGDIKFLEACGVTRAAMGIRRSRLMKNQPKKESANA